MGFISRRTTSYLCAQQKISQIFIVIDVMRLLSVLFLDREDAKSINTTCLHTTEF
ncbi:unnamed protein product [Amoebophrya sp. A120]|nr:unnamed protein product [Amoebophrya sp. A120]|eukprot:GSA120T00018481001.1